MRQEWSKESVVYQIYPRSFYDNPGPSRRTHLVVSRPHIDHSYRDRDLCLDYQRPGAPDGH